MVTADCGSQIRTVLKYQSKKTALVTGAAKRIGRAIAEDLAEQGFAVAIHANTSLGDAEDLAATLRKKGHVAQAFKADLRETAQTTALIGEVDAAFGPLGLLVNNASVFRHDSVEVFDAEIWDAHFSLHLRAPSLLAAEFARQLPVDAGGLIVNIVDQRVMALNPRFYSYTLSKSALWTATQTMAQSLAPRIRVNAIGPGPSMPSPRQTMADFQAQIDGLILKAGPQPAEFGRTIRFLFDTPSITGQMIALDGGQHLAWQTPDVAEIAE